MDLFLAGGWHEVWNACMDDPELEELPFGVMASYVYWKPASMEPIEWARERGRPTFLDSGAFSALSLGVDIDVNKYIQFIKDNQGLFDYVASLDVVFDAESSYRNHQTMLDAGLSVIPAFHTNEPWDHLDAMKDEPMIGLGVGGQQSRKPAVVQWLGEVFDHMSEWEVQPKVHGYAITTPDWMWRFPWHSVDSSSWHAAAKFGRMFVRKGFALSGYHRGSPPKNDLALYQRFKRTIPPVRGSCPDYFPLLRHNIKAYASIVRDITKVRSQQ